MTVKVDVTSLLKKPGKEKNYRSEWQPEDFGFTDEDIEISKPLAVQFHLLNADNHVRVDGNYDGQIRLRCGRCLGTYTDDVQADVEAKYYSMESGGLPEDTYTEDREIVAEEGGIYLDTFEENTIDLGDVVRQDILLESPMRPLCDPDCEGLCPVCGENRNETDCGHEKKDVDPRLSSLQDIDLEEDE